MCMVRACVCVCVHTNTRSKELFKLLFRMTNRHKPCYYLSIYSLGGLEFEIPFEDVDFTHNTLQCTVGEKNIIVKLNDDEISNKENNPFAWTDASTKLFLTLYKEKKDLVTSRKIKTRKVLWQNIAETMQTCGYNVNSTQVENKLKTLERSFKNMKCNNKQTGRGRATCSYEK